MVLVVVVVATVVVVVWRQSPGVIVTRAVRIGGYEKAASDARAERRRPIGSGRTGETRWEEHGDWHMTKPHAMARVHSRSAYNSCEREGERETEGKIREEDTEATCRVSSYNAKLSNKNINLN